MELTTAPADAHYYSRLGLACDPFAAGALPDLFFVGAQRRFLVQRAVHALYFSGAIVLLLGAEGSGKTRTLDEIEKELQELVDVCRFEATVLMDVAEIRGLIVAALGLSMTAAASNAELILALGRMCPADRDPQPVLLAIDAAQLLSVSVLAECAALVKSAGGRVRMLLAGEADLATAWQRAEAGAAQVLELMPLDRNETEDYVRTKLQAVGYREEQPMSTVQFDLLFERSGGNFAAINALAPQFLTAPMPSSVTRRLQALPILHIGAIAALLTLIILLLLYRGEGASTPSASLATQPAIATATKSGAQKDNNEQKTVALELPQTTEQSSVAAPATATTAPINAKAPAAATASAQQSVRVARQSESDANPAVAEKKIAPKRTENSALNADEQALLALPVSHYVLQLMGAETKATIDKFANGAGKGVKIYYYRTQLRGKPWYIVVSSAYPDKAAAMSALEKLPPAVRKQQPWPRSVANVQADIRAHRKP